MFRTAYLLSRSQTIADDITQEVFLRLIGKYHLFDQSKPFRPWLYRLTVNVARNLQRKQRWLRLFKQQEQETLPDAQERPTQFTSEREVQLWHAIEQLSQKCREVIILHYYQDLRLEEVAYALQIPLGTCKSRLNAALAKLRLYMIEEQNERNERSNVYE